MQLVMIMRLAGSLWETDSLGGARQGELKNVS